MTTGGGPLRIGTAERSAAMKALDEHLSAGRLGVEEYADRSAVAANATTADELAGLFTDLPAPHPVLSGPSDPLAAPAGPAVAVPPPAPATARLEGVLETWGPRVVALAPIVAVALFFLTGAWQWFLLIPAMGALVYGGGAGHDDWYGHGRSRRRTRRRNRYR